MLLYLPGNAFGQFISCHFLLPFFLLVCLSFGEQEVVISQDSSSVVDTLLSFSGELLCT
jgi:hypothetical protein